MNDKLKDLKDFSIKIGDIISDTTQNCFNCGAVIKSEVVATCDNDNIGATKPFVCPYCGWKL